MKSFPVVLLALVLFFNPSLHSQELESLERSKAGSDDAESPKIKSNDVIRVYGWRTNQLGQTLSASDGHVKGEEINLRPLQRPGDIFEFVPGMIVTQHSGSGKANQYFARGFNLDHGTDFATFVDGVPINMRSHGHGQGYTDVNFLIPEMIERLSYTKGANNLRAGDFSSVGSAYIKTKTSLDAGLIKVGWGDFGYRRSLIMDDQQWNHSQMIYALEFQRYQGPWKDMGEDLSKRNAQVSYIYSGGDYTASINVQSYANDWNSSEQVPQRAVSAGLINRFSTIDRNLGGDTDRHSLNLSLEKFLDKESRVEANIYAIDYDVSLDSNATYFLDNEEQGDRIRQQDNRRVYGFQNSWETQSEVFDNQWHWLWGIQGRFDRNIETALIGIEQGGQQNDRARHLADISSVGLYQQVEQKWSQSWRSNFSYRLDYLAFEVENQLNGKKARDSLSFGSMQGGAAYLFNPQWETFFSVGQGFHSNDVKGVLASQLENDSESQGNASAIARTLGTEWGILYKFQESFNGSLSLWNLDTDSELVFVGDAGTTEPNRSSRRQGVELAAYWRPSTVLGLDAELSWSKARYREDDDGEGKTVEGYVPLVLSSGVVAHINSHLLLSLRYRHFSQRPLTPDGSVESDSANLVNSSIQLTWQAMVMSLDVYNLLNAKDNDIEYYYASRLTGETTAVDDIHFHPVEPRSFRASLAYRF